MLELKAILLTQGMHGMVSQVEGLAKALDLTYKHQTIKLKAFWNFIPPKISPISENLVQDKFVCDSKIIISCGRKSVIPSIALKKRLGKEIFTIHIQNPKVSFNHFLSAIEGITLFLPQEIIILLSQTNLSFIRFSDIGLILGGIKLQKGLSFIV